MLTVTTMASPHMRSSWVYVCLGKEPLKRAVAPGAIRGRARAAP